MYGLLYKRPKVNKEQNSSKKNIKLKIFSNILYLLNECIVFVDRNFSSSQHGKLPVELLKHHLRFMYKKNTTTITMNPKPAPKNVVVSMETAKEQNTKIIIYFITDNLKEIREGKCRKIWHNTKNSSIIELRNELKDKLRDM